jgi:hypothetical protein
MHYCRRQRIVGREKVRGRSSNSGPSFSVEFNELLFIPIALKTNRIFKITAAPNWASTQEIRSALRDCQITKNQFLHPRNAAAGDCALGGGAVPFLTRRIGGGQQFRSERSGTKCKRSDAECKCHSPEQQTKKIGYGTVLPIKVKSWDHWGLRKLARVRIRR